MDSYGDSTEPQQLTDWEMTAQKSSLEANVHWSKYLTIHLRPESEGNT